MRTWLYSACALALAACGQTTTTTPAGEAPNAAAPAILALQPLGDGPLEGLSGELGCSFRVGQDLLMRAQGNVDDTARSNAIVRRDGALALLEATEAGGYDGMVDHALFAGGGLSVEVTPGAEVQTGTEEVTHNATLRARAGEQEQSYAGVWTCGP